MKVARFIILLCMLLCVLLLVFYGGDLRNFGFSLPVFIGALLIMNMFYIVIGYCAKLPIGIGIGPQLKYGVENKTARVFIFSLSVIFGLLGLLLVITG